MKPLGYYISRGYQYADELEQMIRVLPIQDQLGLMEWLAAYLSDRIRRDNLSSQEKREG